MSFSLHEAQISVTDNHVQLALLHCSDGRLKPAKECFSGTETCVLDLADSHSRSYQLLGIGIVLVKHSSMLSLKVVEL